MAALRIASPKVLVRATVDRKRASLSSIPFLAASLSFLSASSFASQSAFSSARILSRSSRSIFSLSPCFLFLSPPFSLASLFLFPLYPLASSSLVKNFEALSQGHIQCACPSPVLLQAPFQPKPTQPSPPTTLSYLTAQLYSVIKV
jgi:hypothetical protein